MQTSLHAFQLEPHIAVTSQLLTPHNVPCVPNSSTFNQKPVVPHSLSRSSATVENSLSLTETQPTGSLFRLSQFSFQSNQACCLALPVFQTALCFHFHLPFYLIRCFWIMNWALQPKYICSGRCVNSTTASKLLLTDDLQFGSLSIPV